MKAIIVFITTPSVGEARKIAEDLVGERLAACVNIISGVESIYTWQGKLEKGKEVLLIAKTSKGLFRKLEKAVKAVHSYECPEIIALPVGDGSKDYLKWIEESTA